MIISRLIVSRTLYGYIIPAIYFLFSENVNIFSAASVIRDGTHAATVNDLCPVRYFHATTSTVNVNRDGYIIFIQPRTRDQAMALAREGNSRTVARNRPGIARRYPVFEGSTLEIAEGNPARGPARGTACSYL